MVVNERQDDWDLQLPHVEFAHNNSVSAATGLAPNEVHMGRLPRLPLTVFEGTGVAGHQSLARDHLVYCDLATDRQQRANDIAGKHHALTVFRVNRRNSALADALRPVPRFVVGGWAWVCNSASTIRHGVKANTDAKVLKAKLALNWTGPYKVLAVGPCFSADAPDGSPLGDNLLYLDLPSDLPGSNACRRVAIERCKSCDNPHDSSGMPKYLPAGLTQYVLNNIPKKSPPYHVTQDNVSAPLRRLEEEKITGHQSVRGRSGVIAVLYKTHWVGLSEPSWEREMDIQLSRTHILRYGPALRTSTAKPTAFTAGCALARHSVSFPGTTANGFWRPAALASHVRSGFAATRCSPREPTFGTMATMGCGGLEKSARVRQRMEYTWSEFWTTRGRSSFLSLRRATRPQRGPYEVLDASRST